MPKKLAKNEVEKPCSTCLLNPFLHCTPKTQNPGFGYPIRVTRVTHFLAGVSSIRVVSTYWWHYDGSGGGAMMISILSSASALPALLTISGFVLNKNVQRNTSKFAIFLE